MSEEQPSSPPTKRTYRQQPYRYVNFVVYVLAALVNSLPSQTFSSINTIMNKYYHYDTEIITLFTLLFPIFHPIFAFPANWILDKFGMKIGCATGSVLLICGVWLRTLLEPYQPKWCIIGSILGAIGNVFILNSPSILANNWFKSQSIPSIISFSVLANLISVTLGNAMPGFIFSGADYKDQTQAQEAIQGFLRVEAIVVSIGLVITIVFLRNKPSAPPSKSAANQGKKQQGFAQTLKGLFKKGEYVKIMLIMMFSYGVIMSYMVNLDPALSHIGYEHSSSAAASIVLSSMISGIIGSFFFIRKIKKTLQYKYIIAISVLVGTLMFAILNFIIYAKDSVQSMQWSLYIFGACAGFFVIPLTSILMSYSSEVVFPLGEGSATGYLFAASQTFGFISGLVFTALIDSHKPQQGDGLGKLYVFSSIHLFFMAMAFLVSLTTKNILNRTKFQVSKTKWQSEHPQMIRQTQQGLIFSAAE